MISYVWSLGIKCASKSKIVFSTNTIIESRNAICEMFNFQRTDDLGKYVGVPLFHSKTLKNTFQFIMYKMQARLNGFDAKLLSMTRRMILAKVVLLAIPSYFIQAAMVLVDICQKIKLIVRQFLWGSIDTRRKPALVKWESCCKPFSHGGLGLRRLVPQNESFLMKLTFQIVTKMDTLWVKVLCNKYKLADTCSQQINRTNYSYVWRSLTKIWGKF